jgi:NAD(P)-dependent dehydrogenase (short-subunit alcohol dehydrogenase family)
MSAPLSPAGSGTPAPRILLTGGTSGIGAAVAEALVDRGAIVTIVGRSEGRCRRTVGRLRRRQPGAQVDAIVADLSSVAETRRVAAEYRKRSDRLDVLLNNAAGIFKQRRVSTEGHELHVALNQISPFVLSDELLPLLSASAERRADGRARVVNVSSGAHREGVSWDDLQLEHEYEMLRAYGQSKALQLMCTFELARRLEGGPVTVNAIDPGPVRTGIVWKSGARKLGLLYLILGRFKLMSPAKAAGPIVDLAMSSEYRDTNGAYFDGAQPAKPEPTGLGEGEWARAWATTEGWVADADASAAPSAK